MASSVFAFYDETKGVPELPVVVEYETNEEMLSLFNLNKYGCRFTGISERGLNQWDCRNPVNYQIKSIVCYNSTK